ncbi:MAG: RNA-binding S4 domain-containing protein [Alphaproteobacteria bacterium]
MSEPSLRLDKWLWYARFFKSRSTASRLCAASRLRIDGTVVNKAHHKVKLGDVLTFPQGRLIRVVKVLALATRRGPAPEARLLYDDLSPPSSASNLPPAPARSGGRPSKRDRRAIQRLKDWGGEL